MASYARPNFVLGRFRDKRGGIRSMLARMFKRDVVETSTVSGPICPWGVPRLQAARPITEFTAWLIEISKTTELSKRELWNLYGEFCLATDSNALTEGQVFRRIRTAGIVRYRESVGSRRWRYKVETAQIISIQSPDPGS